ncbi:hypothetical protein XU18_1934 [Perkinsela sp. CCAP 1560/4]|nr:hypothetical protein XU18_1934 [Perkinsela sp. CCAP 1560/4]|eukprot:KNH07402.1 hypothetical protein XU18_1934 [Perkinsela sp. CCAP 1560/4]
MTEAGQQLRLELTTQLKMIAKCVNSALDHIEKVEEDCVNSGCTDEHAPSNPDGLQAIHNTKLKVLCIQQHLFNVVFVNFQHSLNESFNTYLESSFTGLLHGNNAEEERTVQDLSNRKDKRIQSQLVTFHRRKMLKLCKYFGIQVPRVLYFDLSKHLQTHTAHQIALDGLMQGALSLGGIVTWRFYPHFTNIIIRLEENDADRERSNHEQADEYMCNLLYMGTPVVSMEWLKKSIIRSEWLPIRYSPSRSSTDTNEYTPAVGTTGTSDLVGSIKYIPTDSLFLDSLSAPVAPSLPSKGPHTESSQSADMENIPQDPSLYLENALRNFEKHTDSCTQLSEKQAPQELESRVSVCRPSRKISRNELQTSIEAASKSKCYLTRKSPAIPKQSDLDLYSHTLMTSDVRHANKGKEHLPVESQVVQYVHSRQLLLSNKEISQKVLCFQFTSSSPRGKYLDIITELGSTFDIGPKYATVATHLIVSGKPHIRSEKMLAFSVEGKWLVTEQFLIDSKKAGDWADETQYEIHRAGSYAQFVRKSSHRAFPGWKVFLATASESHKSMMTMLQLGGAVDVSSTLDQTRLTGFTHLIYDSSVLQSFHKKEVPPVDYYLNRHSIRLAECAVLEEKVRSKEILLVPLEYILHVFSDFGTEGVLRESGGSLKVSGSDVSNSFSRKKLEELAKNIQFSFP